MLSHGQRLARSRHGGRRSGAKISLSTPLSWQRITPKRLPKLGIQGKLRVSPHAAPCTGHHAPNGLPSTKTSEITGTKTNHITGTKWLRLAQHQDQRHKEMSFSERNDALDASPGSILSEILNPSKVSPTFGASAPAPLLHHIKLRVVELGVEAALGEQFLVRAGLHDVAVAHDEDDVRVANR